MKVIRTATSGWFLPIDFAECCSMAWRRAEKLLGSPRHKQLSGEAAITYFDAARKTLERDLILRAQQFSPLQWLSYLRQIPNQISSGELSTTGPYDLALAEILSGESRKVSRSLNYPKSRSIAEYVLDYFAGVQTLSQVHVNLRWAGKGAAFDMTQSALGRREARTDLEQAVKLFDGRIEKDVASGQTMPRTGLGTDAVEKNGCGVAVPMVVRLHGNNNSFSFDILRICMDRLAEFNAMLFAEGLQWWSRQDALLVLFLKISQSLAMGGNSELVDVMKDGFLLTEAEPFLQAAKWTLAAAAREASQLFPGFALPSDPEAFWREVTEFRGTAWPLLSGPIIRIEGNSVALDLNNATLRLQQSAHFSAPGGRIGQLRGPEFERTVQRIIDKTDHAPTDHAPNDMRHLIGAIAYRVDGSRLTDIDAVARRGNQLLLISCKSKEYSGDYDSGDPTSIRELAKFVKQSLRQWREKVEYFRTHPGCVENVDFSVFELIPLLCLPFVPYLPLGPETEEILPGLLAVCSIGELQSWLASH